MTPATRNVWALLALLTLFAVLLVPLPVFGMRLAGDLENFAHAPLFAAVAWGTWRWLRARAAPGSSALRSWLQAWLLASVIGIITELVQPLTGRDNSLHDVGTDLLGISAALLLVATGLLPSRDWRRSLLLASALAATASVVWPVAYTIAAYRHRVALAPRLLDLGSGLGRQFLQRRGIRIDPRPPGGWLITPLQNPWPGLTIDEVLPDWRDYRNLLVDVSNPGTLPVTLLVRIDDRGPGNRYVDHYNNSTILAPGARAQWRLPLSGLQHRTAGRNLDLGAMRRVILFQDTTLRASPALPYVLHDLRLER